MLNVGFEVKKRRVREEKAVGRCFGQPSCEQLSKYDLKG